MALRQPKLIVVGGPNGAGKTTFIREYFVPPEDVERRFYRSYHNFWGAYKSLADVWSLYYNHQEYQPVAIGYEENLSLISDDLFKYFQSIQQNTGKPL